MAGGYASSRTSTATCSTRGIPCATRIPTCPVRRNQERPTAFPSSTCMVHDASYLRLKNATVSYTFDLRKKYPPGCATSRWPSRARTSGSGPSTTVSTPTFRAKAPRSTLRRVDMGAYPRSADVSCSASSCVTKSTRQVPKNDENFKYNCMLTLLAAGLCSHSCSLDGGADLGNFESTAISFCKIRVAVHCGAQFAVTCPCECDLHGHTYMLATECVHRHLRTAPSAYASTPVWT